MHPFLIERDGSCPLWVSGYDLADATERARVFLGCGTPFEVIPYAEELAADDCREVACAAA